jgi:small multidrug resistance family-3 protein
MIIARSIALFVLAALAEIGGAWLIWQGVREHRGLVWIGAGVIALGLYGFVATLQPDANFGRILAAYGGVFVAGSLAWGMVVDKFRPDRYDIIGAVICLAGVGVIMYFPRQAEQHEKCCGRTGIGAKVSGNSRACLLSRSPTEGPVMSSASAQWRPAAPHDRRIARTARGLRVFALLVGVAIVSGRPSRRKP